MRSGKLLIFAAAAAILLAGHTLTLSGQSVKQSGEASRGKNAANAFGEILGAPRIHPQRPAPVGEKSAVQPFMEALLKYAPQK